MARCREKPSKGTGPSDSSELSTEDLDPYADSHSLWTRNTWLSYFPALNLREGKFIKCLIGYRSKVKQAVNQEKARDGAEVKRPILAAVAKVPEGWTKTGRRLLTLP